MSTKLNFKGRHVHGLAFSLGILNPRTGKIGYRLSYSYFLFHVEYEGINSERRWRSEDDFYFIFAVPSWIIIFFFLIPLIGLWNSQSWHINIEKTLRMHKIFLLQYFFCKCNSVIYLLIKLYYTKVGRKTR